MGDAYPCPDCDGHPEDTDDGDYCEECGGDGYVVLDEEQNNVCPKLSYQDSSYICSNTGIFSPG